MSTTVTLPTTRREKRFPVAESTLSVRLYREPHRDPAVVEVTPQDISRNGIKVKCDVPLLFEEPVELQFSSENAELDFRISGEVRWIRGHANEWVIGCLVDGALPDEYIHELSISGGIERRRTERVESRLPAAAQLPGESRTTSVTILDYSENGIRLTCPLAIDRGQRIRLAFADTENKEVEIIAACKWVQPVGGNYLVGCEVSRNSLKNYRELIRGFAKKQEVFEPKKPVWVGAALAFILALVVFYTNL